MRFQLQRIAKSFFGVPLQTYILAAESIEEAEKYYDEKKEYISRSYAQYIGQKSFYGREKIFFLNLVFLSFSPIIVLFICYQYILTRFKKVTPLEQCDIVSFSVSEDYIPNKLDHAKIRYAKKSLSISKSDIKFILSVFVYKPYSAYFLVKILLKVMQYRGLLNAFNTKAILVSAEYSFTSSIMTEYCEKNGVLHINVMHGEKLVNSRDIYFRFHEFYIWDNWYKEEVFSKTKAYKNQFVVSKSRAIRPSIEALNIQAENRVTYYMQGIEKEFDLERIRVVFEEIKRVFPNYEIFYREHPRYKVDSAREILSGYAVDKGDFWDSIAKSKVVISKFSTVLLQGYFYSKSRDEKLAIVIDDVTSKSISFEELQSLSYIMCNKIEKLSKYMLA